MSFTTIVILVFVIGILIAVARMLEENRFKKEYQLALNGYDKSIGLQAGRKYYSFKNKDGKLTLMDEQMIAHDVSAMKVVPDIHK
jgi:hypothetical protein